MTDDTLNLAQRHRFGATASDLCRPVDSEQPEPPWELPSRTWYLWLIVVVAWVIVLLPLAIAVFFGPGPGHNTQLRGAIVVPVVRGAVAAHSYAPVVHTAQSIHPSRLTVVSRLQGRHFSFTRNA